MSKKLKQIITISLLSMLILLTSVSSQASREADTTFRFIIDETVAVFIRSCTTQSVSIDIARDKDRHYVYFPCPLEVVTAAITDYELRFAVMAVVRKGLSQERVAPESLEIKLDQAGMTGVACLPSAEHVVVNNRVIRFIPAVEFPDTLLLFNGCNNTANPTTTAPIEARVNLRKLPGKMLSSGSQVVFTLKFVIIEK